MKWGQHTYTVLSEQSKFAVEVDKPRSILVRADNSCMMLRHHFGGWGSTWQTAVCPEVPGTVTPQLQEQAYHHLQTANVAFQPTFQNTIGLTPICSSILGLWPMFMT